MEEDNSSHVAASTPMDTPEQDGADATKPAVDESSGKGDDEEKPKTLLQALGDQSNRDVANYFAAFSAALALVPLLGLFATERILRSFMSDRNQRWMYSAIVAVVLVNVVLAVYVMQCFAEGFPEVKETKETKETKDTKEMKETTETKETKEMKEMKEMKDTQKEDKQLENEAEAKKDK